MRNSGLSDAGRYNKIMRLELKHDAFRYVAGELECLVDRIKEGAAQEPDLRHRATMHLAVLEIEKLRRKTVKAWYKKKDQLKNS